ncbi:hypothetical protein [Nocardia salmonicida]|uniref:hypothetical protein n=1 Tax=Nocardia salmonicida TaxID=53431 RepID=UPI00362ADD20
MTMVARTNGFATAFAAVMEAANVSTRTLENRLPKDWKTSKTTLNAWAAGRSLPQSENAMLAATTLCFDLATARRAEISKCIPTNQNGWLVLLADAIKEREKDVGQRRHKTVKSSPPRPSTVTARDWGPWGLGVHRAIGGTLPTYVGRAHDDLLRAMFDHHQSRNRLIVLRGGSSTGKTRAAFEAVQACRPSAHVLYPGTGTELANLLQRKLPQRAVLWLNELRDYVEGSDGPAVLASLNQLLNRRENVLVLSSIWPEHWRVYTKSLHQSSGDLGPTRALRPLLQSLSMTTGRAPQDLTPDDVARGAVIDVAERFLAVDLDRARICEDPALEEAIRAADRAGTPGHVTQYLAGVFALHTHYRDPGTDPDQRAMTNVALDAAYGNSLVTAALDAVRLGHARPISPDFLHSVAPGYLTSRDRAVPSDQHDDLRMRGWDYATQLLDGAISALEPIPDPDGLGVIGYRPADYLDQHARHDRAELFPPASFWSALRVHGDSSDLTQLGRAAWNRGLYRDGARLWKAAAQRGDMAAADELVRALCELDPDDTRPRIWVDQLLNSDAAAAIDLSGEQYVDSSGDGLSELTQYAVVDGYLGHALHVAALLRALSRCGKLDELAALAKRAATETLVEDLDAVVAITDALRQTGQNIEVGVLARRAATEGRSEDPRKKLFKALLKADSSATIYSLAMAFLSETTRVGALFDALRHAGQTEALNTLINFYSPDNEMQDMLDTLNDRATADLADITTKYGLAKTVSVRLDELRRAGNATALAALAQEAAFDAPVVHPRDSKELLTALHRAGHPEQVAALAERVASDTAVNDAGATASLLNEIRKVGSRSQVNSLAWRAATSTALDDEHGVIRLLEELRAGGMFGHYAALVRRLPAAGMFPLFTTLDDFWQRYRFGYDPDGSPAEKWGWEDLA